MTELVLKRDQLGFFKSNPFLQETRRETEKSGGEASSLGETSGREEGETGPGAEQGGPEEGDGKGAEPTIAAGLHMAEWVDRF